MRSVSYKEKIVKNKKKLCFLVGTLVLIVFLGVVVIPSLARYYYHSGLDSMEVWQGEVALSYKRGTGTESDPYVISNGGELAYLASQLLTSNYADNYFVLSNDIVLNPGIISYEEEISYLIGGITYQVLDYTNEYYLDNSLVGNLNIFPGLKHFNGHFDGNGHTIYGLYMTSDVSNKLGLFMDLGGSVSNLYVDNALIYGGSLASGIATNSNNAIINNVSFQGNVISASNSLQSKVVSLANQSFSNSLSVDVTLPLIGGNVTSIILTGQLETVGGTYVKVNNVKVTSNSFTVNLGNTLVNSLLLETDANQATLTGMSLQINYDLNVASGIVGEALNSNLNNVINKGKINGSDIASGIVGILSNVNISNAYNTGIINGNTAGGLAGLVVENNNTMISNCYNRGVINASNYGSLIGNIKNANIEISNSFSFMNGYVINEIDNSVVTVNNVYYVGSMGVKVGSPVENLVQTSLNNLKDKTFLENNLSFSAFVSQEDLLLNNNHVWVYDEYPLLYIDDINKVMATINVNSDSFNNYRDSLETIRLTEDFSFAINGVNELRPIREVYYYLSETVLSKNDLKNKNDWVSYHNVVSISQEGKYIIYAKVVDYNNNVFFLNTDLIILDKSGSDIIISLEDKDWSTLNSNVGYYYLDKEQYLSIVAEDEVSGIASVKYYLSPSVLDNNALNNLEDNNWHNYTEEVLINQREKKMLYVRVEDNAGFISYANTDYMVLGGYQEQLKIVKSGNYVGDNHNYLTSKSSLLVNFNYVDTVCYDSSYLHSLVTNILLPVGTKIILRDVVTNKTYLYKINSANDLYGYHNSCEDSSCINEARYSFTLFNEVGKGSTTYYQEHICSGGANEQYEVVIDFKDTNININYNDVYVKLELSSSNGNKIRTLDNSIKKFNIYTMNNDEEADASLVLTVDNDIINLNSNSLTEISLGTEINYQDYNSYVINDTTLEGQTVWLAIRLLDSNNDVVAKDKYQNMQFKMGNYYYSPGIDNVIRINLNTLEDRSLVLKVYTYVANIDLALGQYRLDISAYLSFDGYLKGLESRHVSNIVNVTDNRARDNYQFDIMLDADDKIVSKIAINKEMNFRMVLDDSFVNPIIYVSLFKKNSLTAYNQDYTIVDLNRYLVNAGTSSPSLVYPVNEIFDGQFTLDLVTLDLLKTGYKLVFELYDGNRKISTIDRYFIVK